MGAVDSSGKLRIDYDDGDKEEDVEPERVRPAQESAAGPDGATGSPAVARAAMNSPKAQVWRWATADDDLAVDAKIKVCFRREEDARKAGTLKARRSDL